MLGGVSYTAAAGMDESAESTQKMGKNPGGHGRVPYGVGPRVEAYLRQRFERPRAKRIARELDVGEKVVNRWLGGHAPTLPQLEQMVDRWGEPFLRAVFIEAFTEPAVGLGCIDVAGASRTFVLSNLLRVVPANQYLPRNWRVAPQWSLMAGQTSFARFPPAWWHSPLMRSERSAFLQALLATLPVAANGERQPGR